MGWREDVDIMQQHQTIDWLKCIICQKEGPKTKCQSTGKPSQAALTLLSFLNSIAWSTPVKQKNVLGLSKVKRLHYQFTSVWCFIWKHARGILQTDYIHLACQFRPIKCYDCRQIWQTLFVNTSRRRTLYALQTWKQTYSLQPRLIISTPTLRRQRQ